MVSSSRVSHGVPNPRFVLGNYPAHKSARKNIEMKIPDDLTTVTTDDSGTINVYRQWYAPRLPPGDPPGSARSALPEDSFR